MSNEITKKCVFCKADNSKVPLLQLSFQDKTYWICPQHMPILIHNPDKLLGILPGAENMQAG